MHHRVCLRIGPAGLIDVVGVLREAGGVALAEVRILRVVGCRLADIVPSGPDKLAEAERNVPVACDNDSRVLRAPVCRAVRERRALHVGKCQKPHIRRKMIHAPALYRRACFASVNTPIRVFLMVFIIQTLEIVVAGGL